MSQDAPELEPALGVEELPDPAACVQRARASFARGDVSDAYGWLLRVADQPSSFRTWASAATALRKFETQAPPASRRSVRVAIAGSYTTSQLGALLRLASLRRGVHVELHEADFDTYVQQILDPASALYAFDPDYVILAPHDGAIPFPPFSEDVDAALDAEVSRWTALWDTVSRHSRARVIQHNIAIRPDGPWGHVSARVPGSREEMLRALNMRLARAATDGVLLVDCDRLAGAVGKSHWFDDRYWHLSKQAVALDALPHLARHTAAILAAAEGLSAKCVVLDLDNTLWGGVIAEDGLAGIALGNGPAGEAHVSFQEYLLALRSRGIILAVVSKNNDADAREPFEQHPDMRLALSDMSVFVANWTDKATNLRRVASELNIGLDALVFVDDNPAERQVVRQMLPEVEVIALPTEPAGYVRALADSLLFESAIVTADDLTRAEQYKARAAAAALEQETVSLEDFYASLAMEAVISPFDEMNLSRIVQLIGKTNQFNLTTRRHGLADVREFMDDDRYVTAYLRLRDRFGDHGLVALMIAEQQGEAMEIDTWLMSCRVIGRTVENAMFRRLCEAALEQGCTSVRGTFIRSAKNNIVADLFPRLGFDPISEGPEESRWAYDLSAIGLPASDHIRVAEAAALR
jgi:FkbH-like protein